MSDSRQWEDERVLVTGATSGIGHATTVMLLERGARVFATGRNEEKLQKLQTRYEGRLVGHAADLLNPIHRAELLIGAKKALGNISGAVLAAGAIEHQVFSRVDEPAWQRQLDLNLRAPAEFLQEAMGELAEDASVVVVGSTLAARPILTSAAYSAAKAGLEAVVKVGALSGANNRIRVNLVHPGVIDTPMLEAARPTGESVATLVDSLAALHALGRIGQPEEIARVILDVMKWTFATGSIITVDGGLSIHS